MQQVQNYYKHILPNAAAYIHYFNELRATLESRYQKNPASIKHGTEIILLPLHYDDFDELIMSHDNKQLALQAYHKHIDHTALRYLSKPNRWMAANAKFVQRSNIGAWSTFEEYIPLIALLYLAANDREMPTCDGYTLDSRFEHFIYALALIGRAHNWDQTNEYGAEYDNLQGDKPSCFSGVLRRLMQSVLGHPLLCILTPEMVDAELRDFVREHFYKCWEQLDTEQQQNLTITYDLYIEKLQPELEQSLCAVLLSFNIPNTQQEVFLNHMQRKWNEQWSEFDTQRIRQRLHLAKDGLEACHAHTLGALGFSELLEKTTTDQSLSMQ
ncbi:MAG: hypothetical protein A3E88_02675 [Legionellales bacterium RIFCSPHIGHO2_12_FULL_35_11]|nr:MAG: hypothetical protein A3E88_02675 [Legionellales bacterium RIFCSPHIGHO2_12_FULL_35_11]